MRTLMCTHHYVVVAPQATLGKHDGALYAGSAATVGYVPGRDRIPIWARSVNYAGRYLWWSGALRGA